ncbi:glycoside hydrolase family 18 protein [Sphaerimonospora thailandensis]|uniref:Chitinase n=1 Tax=Sphaerimonospora thailandensis TaxID=795644 RepID=A0A8J3R7X7_9ACTN|nr:hypothetical protein [Sphaerimonospora thailandensis]GIH69495.1 hypothetical protein Mth01_17480 [Sphaerimonospora thailandensis]
MESARPAREAGTPPRFLVFLGASTLVFGTGLALWLLPTSAEPMVVSHQVRAIRTTTTPTTKPATTPMPPPASAVPDPLPVTPGRTYTEFVDASAGPTAARARWYTIGHLTAGPDGCTLRWTGRWAGRPALDHIPVADRLALFRAEGGDADIAFGGPYGSELSASCPSEARLIAAYRRVIRTFDPAGLDFEVHDSADAAATRRRAAAIARLQRDSRDRGRPISITFTLPASEYGMAAADMSMLRAVRTAGAEIDTVNLLVPSSRGLHGLAAAARSAQGQLQRLLDVDGTSAWRRIALTPVLSDPRDLGVAEARRLAAFRARHGLAWLSLRGAKPPKSVIRTLSDLAE